MTTGLVIDPRAQCRSCGPISMTSAFSLSSSTVARRTVHTLIGSYVALSTSTRPPDQRPEPSVVDPCRRRSTSGTDPVGAGGTAVAIAGRSVVGRCGVSGGGRERTEDPHGLAMRPQAGDRGGDVRIRSRAHELAEEHVVAEADPARAGLDPAQRDRAGGELLQAVDQPARLQIAAAPEHERGLEPRRL